MTPQTPQKTKTPSTVSTAPGASEDALSTAEHNFAAIANPLIARGLPVIPLKPNSKVAILQTWPELASTDASTITAWAEQFPTANVAVVAGDYAMLDWDVPELRALLEMETGQKLPATLTVRTPGRGGMHDYFRHTERSRAVGNLKHPGEWDLQARRKYVVGPGSVINGKAYEVVSDAPIADFPDWLLDWLMANGEAEQNSSKERKRRPTDCRRVVPAFDLEDFFQHYGITIEDTRGNWYIPDVCPIAGHKHEQSQTTGFYFDGEVFGWHCFASGCPGSRMSIGEVIKHLNKAEWPKITAPYAGPIWTAEEKPAAQPEQPKSSKVWLSHAELRAKAAAAPEPELVAGFLPEKCQALAVGESTIGKSPLVLQLALCVAYGVPFLGMTAKRGRVLIVDYENSTAALDAIMASLCAHLGVDCPVSEDWLRVVHEPESANDVLALVQEYKPALVTIDALRPFCPEAETGNDEAAKLLAVLRKHDTAWVLVHHPRKESADSEKKPMPLEAAVRVVDWLQAASGARALVNQTAVRIAIDTRPREKPGDLFMRWNFKAVGDKGPVIIGRDLDDEGEPAGYSQVTGIDLLAPEYKEMLTALLDGQDAAGPLHFRDVRARLGAKGQPNSKKKASALIDACTYAGLVTSLGKAKSRNRQYVFQVGQVREGYDLDLALELTGL